MKVAGFGLGLRTEFMAELLEKHEHAIDWLEIIPENWIDLGGKRGRDLERCAERWPLVPHSVSMSIGGLDPLDRKLFRDVGARWRAIDAPFWSDHICYAVLHGKHVHDLLPLPCSDEALEHVLRRIAEARAMTDVPLVFENPTYYVKMPGATMSEPAFLTHVFRESGAGFLLDVNNVYVNSQNHGFDAKRYIDALPLDAVKQIHLAGHTVAGSVIVDTHRGHVVEAVWDLYRYALARARRLIPTLLEWDSELPKLEVLVGELERARREADRALADVNGNKAAEKAA